MHTGTWLFVLPWDLHHPGGVNQVVENLFDANTQILGNRSLLWVNRWTAQRPRIVVVDGRRTVHGRGRSPWVASEPWRNALAFAIELPAALVRLRRLVKQEGVVRIHVHYPGLDALVWVALRRLFSMPPRLILSFHGADLTTAAASTGVGRRLWNELLSAADEIVVCSEQLRADFERSFEKLPHLQVIDNGVDPQSIVRKVAGTPALQLPSKYLLSLATFENKKGLDVLLQAFDSIAERDHEIHLVVAGRKADDDYFEHIGQQHRQLRHADRVQLLTDVSHEQAMRMLAKAQVLVLASRLEPFGIVVLEAGALAKPVVATSVCGVTQRLTSGADLLVVPPDDAPALAAAIQRILADDPLANRLAMSLRQRVHSEFTWAHIVRQYAAIGAVA